MWDRAWEEVAEVLETWTSFFCVGESGIQQAISSYKLLTQVE